MIPANTARDEAMLDAAEDNDYVVPLLTSGGDLPPEVTSTPIFRFRFGGDAHPTDDPVELCIALQPLHSADVTETWVTQSAVTTGTLANVRYSKGDEYLFSSISAPISAARPIREVANDAYVALLETARSIGYPHLVRSWNYFPDINVGAADDERYRQFCLGRAAAFSQANVKAAAFPAGTAIGTRTGSSLQVVLLSGRASARMVENSRQTSAYQYPRRHGPVGPSFARASYFETDSAQQLFLSGTASIVGSESCHIDDPDKQLDETLRNIRILLGNSSTGSETALTSPLFRVYLRHAGDAAAIRSRIREEYGPHARAVFFEGDICRAELSIEIEGVFWSK